EVSAVPDPSCAPASRAGARARIRHRLLPRQAGRLRPAQARGRDERSPRWHLSRRVVRRPLLAAYAPVSHGRPRTGRMMQRMMQGMHFDDYRTTHVGPESWAKDYDAKLFSPGSFDAAIWEREQRLIDEIVGKHVPRRQTYLDFACGTGRVLAHVEPYFESAVGLDISDTMLAAASSRVKAATLVQGDATTDPAVLHGSRFDFITAFRFFLNAQPALRDDAMAFFASALRDRDS